MLDVVLRSFPETLQDKNLILSGKQYLNSMCTVLSKMVREVKFFTFHTKNTHLEFYFTFRFQIMIFCLDYFVFLMICADLICTLEFFQYVLYSVLIKFIHTYIYSVAYHIIP